jgi:hypothetical protein
MMSETEYKSMLILEKEQKAREELISLLKEIREDFARMDKERKSCTTCRNRVAIRGIYYCFAVLYHSSFNIIGAAISTIPTLKGQPCCEKDQPLSHWEPRDHDS